MTDKACDTAWGISVPHGVLISFAGMVFGDASIFLCRAPEVSVL